MQLLNQCHQNFVICFVCTTSLRNEILQEKKFTNAAERWQPKMVCIFTAMSFDWERRKIMSLEAGAAGGRRSSWITAHLNGSMSFLKNSVCCVDRFTQVLDAFYFYFMWRENVSVPPRSDFKTRVTTQGFNFRPLGTESFFVP